MAAPKGHAKYGGGGSRKGKPNKTTTALKEMILQALSAAGGVRYLQTVAQQNPAAFCTLLGKVLPLTVAGDSSGQLVVQVVNYADAGSDGGEAASAKMVH
jgi:hypothetical protein